MDWNEMLECVGVFFVIDYWKLSREKTDSLFLDAFF